MIINQTFLDKAKALEPVLFKKEVHPVATVKLVEDNSLRLGWRAVTDGTADELYGRALSQDDEFVLDFGEHLVGFLNLWYEAAEGDGDAPLRLKLTFGEVPCDTAVPAESFDGVLGRGWIQTEVVTMDVIPGNVQLPRRYAFRYVKIKIEGSSPFYKVRFPKITATAITSADESKLNPLPEGTAPLLAERIGDTAEAEFAREKAEIIINASRRELYDEKLGLYVSGENREISWRSQICAAASGIEPRENVKALFERAEKYPGCRKIQSTTTYALYIQALIDCDMKDKALEVIKEYFGAQLREGGTTFFEHFHFDSEYVCPYRHIIVDSYCHSCQAVASYFIRKYFV